MKSGFGLGLALSFRSALVSTVLAAVSVFSADTKETPGVLLGGTIDSIRVHQGELRGYLLMVTLHNTGSSTVALSGWGEDLEKGRKAAGEAEVFLTPITITWEKNDKEIRKGQHVLHSTVFIEPRSKSSIVLFEDVDFPEGEYLVSIRMELPPATSNSGMPVGFSLPRYRVKFENASVKVSGDLGGVQGSVSPQPAPKSPAPIPSSRPQ
jgi:hypothetical protein